MPEPNHIVIIGGTACGPKAAARALRCDPHAKITIIEQGPNLSTATCGLPYYISGVIKDEGPMVARPPQHFRDVLGMTVLNNTRATAIDRQKRTVTVTDLKTKQNSTITYDKLVLATGSAPVRPDWTGADLKGIFTLSDLPDANAIKQYVAAAKTGDAVIVGAGLIGLEMAEALATLGLKVTVLEALGWPLPQLLDEAMAAPIARHLESKGVTLRFGERVTGFDGDKDGRVASVITGGGEVKTGLVLLALGVRPQVGLARAAGLKIGALSGIAVNEYLETSDPAIYAGGDCVEVFNIITRKPMLAPMGSTANKHGRIIGSNVTGGHLTFPGGLGTAICKVFDYNAGRTGLSAAQAGEAGFETLTALVPALEHAGYYPGAREITVRLVAEKDSGKLLGGQVVGTGDVAKRIDVLAAAISRGATVDDLADLDLAYAPPFNSALDPLHHAANIIRNQRDGLARKLTMAEVKTRLDRGDDFVLLDVRSLPEWKMERIKAEQVRFLPLTELRRRHGELPRDAEIVIYCRTSVRAYQAQRILDGEGFTDVRFMEGSLAVWPYATESG